jgi:hypothetical protein
MRANVILNTLEFAVWSVLVSMIVNSPERAANPDPRS